MSQSTKEVLQAHLAALQAQREEHIAPLNAARIQRDRLFEEHAALFAQERELAKRIKELQSDTRLSELERDISATARALGGLRMNG